MSGQHPTRHNPSQPVSMKINLRNLGLAMFEILTDCVSIFVWLFILREEVILPLSLLSHVLSPGGTVAAAWWLGLSLAPPSPPPARPLQAVRAGLHRGPPRLLLDPRHHPHSPGQTGAVRVTSQSKVIRTC